MIHDDLNIFSFQIKPRKQHSHFEYSLKISIRWKSKDRKCLTILHLLQKIFYLSFILFLFIYSIFKQDKTLQHIYNCYQCVSCKLVKLVK